MCKARWPADKMLDRASCLLKKLTLEPKALNADTKCSMNPDTFIRAEQLVTRNILGGIEAAQMTHMIWKKVQVEVNNKVQQKIKRLP